MWLSYFVAGIAVGVPIGIGVMELMDIYLDPVDVRDGGVL